MWEESGQKKDDFPGLLTLVEEAKFLEGCGVNKYRWSHDNLQEAALPETSFQFEVGSLLRYRLSEEDLEDSIFEVANLINSDVETLINNMGNSSKQAEYAEINLRAAEKARSISAFYSAATYATKGIELLPSDNWSTHRDLTLRLYTLGGEMELALGPIGNLQTCGYSNEVISRNDCSALEKLSVYMAEINKLTTTDRNYKAAIDLCLSVLKELGCTLFRSRALLPIKAITQLMQTIKKAKKTSMEVYTALKPMTSPTQQAIMHLLTSLSYACYLGKDTFLHLLCAPRQVELTMKYGLSA